MESEHRESFLKYIKVKCYAERPMYSSEERDFNQSKINEKLEKALQRRQFL